MVFSPIPVYLDPPNWHQQTNQHQENGSNNSPQLLASLPQQPQVSQVGVDAVGPIRPGSIVDQSKKPPQEGAFKCPRCESTNTKFCYFNNYNLSQPRHFCKTCRRYWTRGGALRNVPVGGGCRKNKKNKRSRSKSPVSTEKPSLSNSISSIPELTGRSPQPFMASLQNISRYSVAGGVDQWRFQQFPFLNGFESTSAVSYPFQSVCVEGLVGDVAATSGATQMASQVKLEYNGSLNLSRSPLSISENNNHYYSWTDLSGFASSSASHLL